MPDETKKKVSTLTRATEVIDGSLFFVSEPDSTTESGYTSKASTVDVMAEKILGGIQYQTELQTTAKDIFGAINEAASTGGGSNVTMSDDAEGGVDLTVNGTMRNLAKQDDLMTTNNALSSLEETVVTGKYMDSFNLEMGWITKSGIDQDNTDTNRGVRTVNYIKLSDVEDLIIGERLGNSTIFSYDENKNFLRRKGYSTGSSLKDGTIALGDDVIYIRLVLYYDSSVIGEPTFEKFRECWSLEYKTGFSALDDRLTSVEKAISKEWTAIGTITTDNKDTELTVDLTGYSELYIVGNSLATGVTSLTVNGKSLTTTSSTSTTGMTTNGSRFVVMMFADDGTGAMYPVIYKHGTDYTSGLISNLSSYWLPLKISDITKIAFKDSSLITTCTFSILAR